VAASARRGTSLDETKSLCAAAGPEALAIEMDVDDPEQIRRGAAAAEAEFGCVDILVNNAGINRPSPAVELTADDWDAVFRTNVRGGFLLAQTVVGGMIERGWGRIIWVSSQAGLVGIPGQSVYCSSKGAVVQLVRALAVEWAKAGVTVNSVAPTFVETNLTRERLRNPEFRSFVLERIPSRRLATPQDIAAAVVFLAGEQAGMITGVNLPVDGGWTAW
jgi:2-deoxy-D-gluconate 3-dehydrogenase